LISRNASLAEAVKPTDPAKLTRRWIAPMTKGAFVLHSLQSYWTGSKTTRTPEMFIVKLHTGQGKTRGLCPASHREYDMEVFAAPAWQHFLYRLKSLFLWEYAMPLGVAVFAILVQFVETDCQLHSKPPSSCQ